MAHRLHRGCGCGQCPMVGAVRRPGARRVDRRVAARESRSGDRRRARGPVHRRALDDALAVLPADRLQRRCKPRPLEQRRAAADSRRQRSLLHALPGSARRAVADRSVRPRSPPERGGPGAGLRKRAGPPRRRALGRHERGGELHRPARAGPAARDRTGDGEELRRHQADLRPAPQGRRRVAGRSRADRVAVPAGPRRDSKLRAAGRRAGEPDLGTARPQPRPHRAREDDR